MHTGYLGLGANIGDRLENLRKAARMLEEDGSCRVVSASSVYETVPVGPQDQPAYLNAVIEIETTLAPRDLLDRCGDIENKLGRVRTIRWGPRVIDIDILLYDRISLSERDLRIPHPRMLQRPFVLIPLAEIAPAAMIAPGLTAAQAAEGVSREGILGVAAGPSWLEQ